MQCSQTVTHPNIDHIWCCFASTTRTEPVFPTRHGLEGIHSSDIVSMIQHAGIVSIFIYWRHSSTAVKYPVKRVVFIFVKMYIKSISTFPMHVAYFNEMYEYMSVVWATKSLCGKNYKSSICVSCRICIQHRTDTKRTSVLTPFTAYSIGIRSVGYATGIMIVNNDLSFMCPLLVFRVKEFTKNFLLS
jgi:hypothetical protein